MKYEDIRNMPHGGFHESETRFKDYETAMKFQMTGDYSLAVPKMIGDKLNQEWVDARYAMGIIVSPYLAEKIRNTTN